MADAMSSIADYKLKGCLPPRSSRNERLAHRNAVRLFEEVDREDFDWIKTAEIDPSARFCLSQELDASVLRVYNSCIQKIQEQPQHKSNYRELVAAPLNCGGFSLDTTILKEANPLEQMVALAHWIQEKGPKWHKGRRTLCLGAPGNEYIPVYIGKRAGVDPTPMSVMLGAAKGDYKAPKYSDLAADSELAENSVFKDPLDALEIVRQSYFSSATLIKAGAFSRGEIDAQRRYEVEDENMDGRISQFACVELTQQNAPRNSPTKETSAGTNLYSLLKHNADTPINKGVLFENFAHEGYNDEAEIEVTPQMLWDATKESVCKQRREELDLLMEKLFMSHVGGFSSTVVADFYANRIFPSKGDS